MWAAVGVPHLLMLVGAVDWARCGECGVAEAALFGRESCSGGSEAPLLLASSKFLPSATICATLWRTSLLDHWCDKRSSVAFATVVRPISATVAAVIRYFVFILSSLN